MHVIFWEHWHRDLSICDAANKPSDNTAWKCLKECLKPANQKSTSIPPSVPTDSTKHRPTLFPWYPRRLSRRHSAFGYACWNDDIYTKELSRNIHNLWERVTPTLDWIAWLGVTARSKHSGENYMVQLVLNVGGATFRDVWKNDNKRYFGRTSTA